MLIALLSIAATPWQIDRSASQISFAIEARFNSVEGVFETWDGLIFTAPPTTPTAAFGEVVRADTPMAWAAAVTGMTITLQTGSVDTGTRMLNRHLQDDRFFDSELYPQARFTLSAVTPGAGSKLQFAGELNIKDASRKVTGEAICKGRVALVTCKADLALDRNDYHITGNSRLNPIDAVARLKVKLVFVPEPPRTTP